MSTIGSSFGAPGSLPGWIPIVNSHFLGLLVFWQDLARYWRDFARIWIALATFVPSFGNPVHLIARKMSVLAKFGLYCKILSRTRITHVLLAREKCGHCGETFSQTPCFLEAIFLKKCRYLRLSPSLLSRDCFTGTSRCFMFSRKIFRWFHELSWLFCEVFSWNDLFTVSTFTNSTLVSLDLEHSLRDFVAKSFAFLRGSLSCSREFSRNGGFRVLIRQVPAYFAGLSFLTTMFAYLRDSVFFLRENGDLCGRLLFLRENGDFRVLENFLRDFHPLARKGLL